MKTRRIIAEYPITCCVSFNGILALFATSFTGPTFSIFEILVTGAVLLHRRHTVTNMIRAVGLRHSHHARFHRFFSQARWDLTELWRHFVVAVVRRFYDPDEVIVVGVDDTAERKTGGKIYGTSVVHDNRPAVRKAWSFSWGHTWVIASILVRAKRWASRWYAFPAQIALYRTRRLCQAQKRCHQTKAELALQIVLEIVSWLPERLFLLLVDGAYASGTLMRHLPPNVHVVGRMRTDAAVYDLPPTPARRRGRKRLKGCRLPTPEETGRRSDARWERVTVDGVAYEVMRRVVLWWKVFRERPVWMVLCRRPGGKVHAFYSTDLKMTAARVVEWYARRWPIEIMFHEAKERMGFEEAQCRTQKAVERTVPFLLLVLGLVQHWFLSQQNPDLIGFRPRWYGKRRAPDVPPSFSEMLAALRRTTWQERFLCRSSSKAEIRKTLEALVQMASTAA
ncbi:MAG: transposase [Candidatus Aminicenantes bacterium]|nr:transposase [Candidatus Aminicenantes bacterium]